jgi:hypothetical protein
VTFDTFKVGKKMKTAILNSKKIDKILPRPCSTGEIISEKEGI